VKRTYEYANLEAEQWLRAVMAPVEAQVREHQLQLRRRVESIRRIHEATETLEDRMAELDQVGASLGGQIAELKGHARAIGALLKTDASASANAPILAGV
jgi:hypothetical protein